MPALYKVRLPSTMTSFIHVEVAFGEQVSVAQNESVQNGPQTAARGTF